MTRFFISTTLALAAVHAGAADFSSSAAGTTAADFLNLGVGARAAAMGGAYSAVADDATALYWNPAGLTRVLDRSATVMHAAYIASSYFDYGAYAQNFGSYGALGLGVQYFSAGSVNETDAAFNPIGTVTPYDLAASIGYAYKFDSLGGISVGVTGKYIESKLADSAKTEALDAGLLSPAYLDGNLRLAITMRNLGRAIKYDQTPEQLPLVFGAGGAYRITSNWLVALDVDAPKNNNPYANIGTEYLLVGGKSWRFAGRAGYSSQTAQGITGFTGASIGIGIGYEGMNVDYAFVPYGSVGTAQRISLTYNF